MTGLDTNVLLRILLGDDAEQAARADAFVAAHCSAESPCLINRIVVAETAWVLERAYGYGRSDAAGIVENILRTATFAVEDAEETWAALRAFRTGTADFSDCLIAATNRAQGCETTGTFDLAAQQLEGFVAV